MSGCTSTHHGTEKSYTISETFLPKQKSWVVFNQGINILYCVKILTKRLTQS